MIVSKLRVNNVRKIAAADLCFSPQVNLVVGPNGSGKTSFLESLFLLSGGRSFRTSRARDIIRHGEDSLTVVGEVVSPPQTSILGIEKTATTTRLRLNNENVATASTTVRLLPMLVLNSESFKLLEGGPSNRRDLLDRMLFHVEPNYFSLLREFYHVLKQRNASVRSGSEARQITLWDQPLTVAANRIHQYRERQVETLNAALRSAEIDEHVGELTLNYEPGWKKDLSFSGALGRALERDRLMGTTTVGPHRAEVKVLLDGKPAKRSASRGQTKLIVVALIAGMESVIFRATKKAPILLIDDLGSELDSLTKLKAIQLLTRVKTQAFFTAIEYNMLVGFIYDSSTVGVFHVEQGQDRSRLDRYFMAFLE